MILVRRWADRRRIRQLKKQWEAFRAICELEIAARDSGEQADGAENGAAERVENGSADRSGNGLALAGHETAPAWRRSASVMAPLEGRFLRIKAETARLLPVLSEVVGRRALEQEAEAAQRDMTELLNRVPSLADLERMSAAEQQAILREWHVLYLFLAKLEGAMTGTAIHGAALSAPADWMRRDTRERRSRAAAVAGFGLEAAIVLGFLFLAAAMLGIDRSQVRQLGSAALRGDLGHAAHRVAGADVAQTPTGETEVTASAAPDSSSTQVSVPAAAPPAPPTAPVTPPARTEQAFAFRMPRVVQPVLLRYGTAGSYLLAGAFACGLALLFGLRSRS
jgi:hypothetical protein